MKEPVVIARQLERHFVRGAETVRALDGVDLDVRAGELLAIVGPSGSGKSTLLYLLAGLDRPTGGELRLFGERREALTEKALVELRRHQIGFVFQRFHLMSALSVRENVLLPNLFARRTMSAEQGRTILGRVGLLELADRPIDELSNGARQKVAIARALVGDPQLLVADEPSARLDRQEASEVAELLRRIADDGVAVVVATHDEVIAARAHRALHIRSGRWEESTRER
ncbi:MAG: ABC transporter ATP-binding protein [Planctomycetota bacterium]